MPKRLPETAEGTQSPVMAIRIPQRTLDQLDALIASLPPNPLGLAPPPRVIVVRAVIEAGINAIARKAGIKLPGRPEAPGALVKVIGQKRPPKTHPALGGATLGAHPPPKKHHGTLARSERRAAEREAAGCTCKGKHLASCKLSKHAKTIAATN